jgi:hypothetical protein
LDGEERRRRKQSGGTIREKVERGEDKKSANTVREPR